MRRRQDRPLHWLCKLIGCRIGPPVTYACGCTDESCERCGIGTYAIPLFDHRDPCLWGAKEPRQ